MANPAKLEINSWIETVRKQLEQAENASRNSSGRSNAVRGKRNRNGVDSDPTEAQAALIALDDLQKLLTTRVEEIDQLELEFLERSQRLDAAATQLEEQFKQVAAQQTSYAIPPSTWAVNAETPATPTSESSSASLECVANRMADRVTDQIANQVADHVATQLSAILDEKLKQITDRATVEPGNHFTNATIANSEEMATATAELRIELEVSRKLQRETETLLQQVADDAEAKVNELRDELAAVYETNAALHAKIVTMQDPQLTCEHEQQDTPDSKEANLIAELQAEIESLQSTLVAVRSDYEHSEDNRSNPWSVESSRLHAEDELHNTETIETLNAELADLREQNADLATQLARMQISGLHNPPHLNLSNLSQESMTWEQRKRLILQQLENESAAANPEEYQNHRNEVEEILRTTQREIERRDQEIAELKSIVQQQSNTREGVAIGAAAIAQMLDSDELVKLEREKLAAIQREWESKLREAEIEMSMERAKLSRERAELEERLRNPVDTVKPASPEPAINADGKPVRRWLEHLGLRDK